AGSLDMATWGMCRPSGRFPILVKVRSAAPLGGRRERRHERLKLVELDDIGRCHPDLSVFAGGVDALLNSQNRT
ncbi:MAG: hypothetical protein JWN04_1208, partial [Myxococcaceae bacterium]|nr:hypothetical protein [Myxococcaceae bacterium]